MSTPELPEALPTQAPIDNVPVAARPLQGHRAGIVTRVLANSVDFVVLLFALGGAYVVWFSTLLIFNGVNFKPPIPNLAGVLIFAFIWLFFYLAVCWAATGRTVGDWVLGLRVVSFRGQKLRWFGAVLRAAFCAFFIPGLFWVIFSPSNRSLQDTVLRTSVIYDWTTRAQRGMKQQ